MNSFIFMIIHVSFHSKLVLANGWAHCALKLFVWPMFAFDMDSCCVLARALVLTNHTEPRTPRCPRGKLGSDVKIDVLGIHYHLFKGWID